VVRLWGGRGAVVGRTWCGCGADVVRLWGGRCRSVRDPGAPPQDPPSFRVKRRFRRCGAGWWYRVPGFGAADPPVMQVKSGWKPVRDHSLCRQELGVLASECRGESWSVSIDGSSSASGRDLGVERRDGGASDGGGSGLGWVRDTTVASEAVVGVWWVGVGFASRRVERFTCNHGGWVSKNRWSIPLAGFEWIRGAHPPPDLSALHSKPRCART